MEGLVNTRTKGNGGVDQHKDRREWKGWSTTRTEGNGRVGQHKDRREWRGWSTQGQKGMEGLVKTRTYRSWQDTNNTRTSIQYQISKTVMNYVHHTCPDWFTPVQTASYLYRLVHTCTDHVHSATHLYRMVHSCTDYAHTCTDHVHTCTDWSIPVQTTCTPHRTCRPYLLHTLPMTNIDIDFHSIPDSKSIHCLHSVHGSCSCRRSSNL